MIELLLFALISSLIITCIHVLFWDGMLLGSIRANMDDFLPYFWQKPVYACVICMASFWGLTIYGVSLINGFELGHPLLMLVPYLLLVCGINTLISGLIYLAFEKNTTEI